MQNNKTFYQILMAVILVLAITVGTYAALKYMGSKETAEPTVNSPEQVVNDFYGMWINHEGNPMMDRVYQNNSLVTPALSQRIDEIIAGFDMGGYDPVLCAQDIPQSFTVESVELTGNQASVLLSLDFYGFPRPVLVSLINNGSWKLDNISCIEESEVVDGPETGYTICVDKCGDGVCDEMVCMGEGCPCPETAESCPADCR
jgi:hypothetical protein